ncbi:MAG: hypothetical protein EZS28_044472, partial [Streblomastix strix]
AVVQRIVEAWHGQWRRHVSALTILAKYLEQNNQQWKELRTLEQPSAFMANFLSDQMEKGASDNSLKSCRWALAVLMSFIEYKEEEVHSKLVAQLMKPVLMRTRHKDREIEQWDLNILLEQIVKEEVELLQSNLSLEEIMTISLTLCMIFTVARLAELFRATLINETEKEITLETVILKKPSRIIELKLKKALDQRICPVRWWKAWNNNRDKDLNPTTGYLWNTSKLNKTNSSDCLIKGIRSLMQKAGIFRGFTVTDLKSAIFIQLISMGTNSTAVDRFTHHSDVASTVRQYYDKNNNNQIRAFNTKVKEESAGESESEIAAEVAFGLNFRTSSTVNISPQEEESESFLYKQFNKYKQNASFQRMVIHELKVHAISSEREVNTAFVLPIRKCISKKKKQNEDGTPTYHKSVSAREIINEQPQNGTG